MHRSLLRLALIAKLLAATMLSCGLSLLLATPADVPPDATVTRALSLASPVPSETRASLPSLTFTPAPTLTATPPGEYYGRIRITGSPEFIEQTRQALALLEDKASEAYLKIQTYVGIIEQGLHSGKWAWEVPPRYEVGDPTAFYSVTWYASTIAHDATHSELYHNGQEWSGVTVEQFCNAYQLTVLQQIEAPQSEIDYLAGLDGNHCDVDGDGDCDWTDYENRDW